MSGSAVSPRDRYYVLDGMRGIAALLVVIYHTQQHWHGNSVSGYLAVDLFFALSGFVIALNYTQRFAKGLSFYRFFELRLVRLYPLYALGLLLGIAKFAAGRILHVPLAAAVGSPACAIVAGLVMLPDPCSSGLFPLNGPSWSLFFELLINGAFAAYLWRCSVSVLVVLMAAAALTFPFTIAEPHFFNIGFDWQDAGSGFARTVYSFCAGVVIYRTLPLAKRRTLFLAPAAIVGLAIVISINIPDSWKSEAQIVTVTALFPLLLTAGCLYEMPPGKIRTLCGFLGDLSYPIYAMHWPLISLFIPLAIRLKLSPSITVLLFLVAMILIAFGAAEVDKVARSRISSALKLRRTAVRQESEDAGNTELSRDA